MKFCSKCQTNKESDEFYRDRHNKDGLTTQCGGCREAAARATWEQKTPEEKLAARVRKKETRRQNLGNERRLAKINYSHSPEQYQRARRKSRLKKLGLTEANYETMLGEQHDCCPICETKFDHAGPKRNIPSLDHDHETGKVRGLLCNPCNIALGLFKDSAAALGRAVEYLKKHKQNTK